MGVYIKYLMYVLRHKWYVGLECFRAGLYWRGIKHDWSKLLPSEFVPYARYFYGGPYPSLSKNHGDIRNDTSIIWKEEVDSDFDYAWNLHQKRNRHHWQFWILLKDDGSQIPLSMPYRDRLEMVCDWMGAGASIKHQKADLVETRNWYIKNQEKMRLHRATRYWVEHKIGLAKEDAKGEG